MDIQNLVAALDKLPFMLVKDRVVIDVSEHFIADIQFNDCDFLNCNIEDVFKTLRISPKVDIDNIDEKLDYFLFTKSLEAKLVNIKIIDIGQYKVYIFVANPKFNLNNKFPFLCKLCEDNYDGVAVFSLPDMTLLKANETFVSFLDNPFNKIENCLGNELSQFVSGFEGSESEKVWQNVIRTGETYHTDEFTFYRPHRGTNYYKSTITPLYEDGKLKYGVEITTDITDQVMQRKKVAEQAITIMQQNDKLKEQADLLNLCSEAIFAWKPKDGIIYWNKGAEQLYGYSSEEALGCISHQKLKSVFPFSIEQFESTLEKNGVWKGLIEHTKKDGTKLIVSSSMQIIKDRNGQQIVLEANRDFTEVKKMETETKRQKDELREIIESIDDAIFIYDSNKNFYLVNSAGRELYSNIDFTNFDNLNNTTDYTYYDENGTEIDSENLVVSRVLRGEVVINYKMTFKNSLRTKHFSVNGRPIYNNYGEIKFVVLSCRDITQDVEVKKLIERQKVQLETIIENMPNPCTVYDKDENLLFLNAEAREMYPKLEAEKTADSSYKSFRYFDLNDNEILTKELPTKRAFKGEKVRNETIVFKQPDNVKVIRINSTPIFDENKNLTSVVTSHYDVTELIKSQEEIKVKSDKIIKAEREKNEALEKAMQMKDDFISLVSHEFRTPLNVINTAIQAMHYICGNELSDKSKKYLNIIRQNTFRQLRLVNNLLDITRADAGRMKIHKKNIDIVFLTNSIVESVHTYALQKEVTITFKSSISKKIIGIDDEKYERILLNLLSNAIKFTPSGKHIIVKLRVVKSNIYIEVKDNGIGIPKEKINEIFERFGQVDSSLSRQAEGSGIGLSLVKRFVEALDGNISVNSTEGEGSTFKVILPTDMVTEDFHEDRPSDLLDNRLIQSTTVEFSDIYL